MKISKSSSCDLAWKVPEHPSTSTLLVKSLISTPTCCEYNNVSPSVYRKKWHHLGNRHSSGCWKWFPGVLGSCFGNKTKFGHFFNKAHVSKWLLQLKQMLQVTVKIHCTISHWFYGAWKMYGVERFGLIF